jgi:hypothetical protein
MVCACVHQSGGFVFILSPPHRTRIDWSRADRVSKQASERRTKRSVDRSVDATMIPWTRCHHHDALTHTNTMRDATRPTLLALVLLVTHSATPRRHMLVNGATIPLVASASWNGVYHAIGDTHELMEGDATDRYGRAEGTTTNRTHARGAHDEARRAALLTRRAGCCCGAMDRVVSCRVFPQCHLHSRSVVVRSASSAALSILQSLVRRFSSPRRVGSRRPGRIAEWCARSFNGRWCRSNSTPHTANRRHAAEIPRAGDEGGRQSRNAHRRG